MRRTFFQKPKPTDQAGQGMAPGLPELQVRILDILLISLAVIGAPVLLWYLSRAIPQAKWGLVILCVFAYLCILWLALNKNLSYRLRAFGFALVPYLIGAVTMMQKGLPGNGRTWMLGFSILVSLLLGLRMGIGSIILGVLTLFGSGYLIGLGIFTPPDPNLSLTSDSLIDWVWAGVLWTFIAVTITAAINLLVQGLMNALEKEKILSGILTTDREQASLRARELDRRLLQIRTAAAVSRSLSGVLEPKQLLQQVVDLVQERFKLYYAGVYLSDENGENAVLSAGTGREGEAMLEENHKLEIGGTSMVGWAIANRKPRIALDVGRDPMRFNNPRLPLTRSEMVLPLISSEQVFGAMTVQSTLPEAFDQDDITVMQGIADSLATSLQNARLFEQSQKNLQEIQALNRQYMLQTWKKAREVPVLQRSSYVNDNYQGLAELITTQHFPILLRDQAIGQISLDIDRRELTPEEQTLIQEVTTQAALAMENVRLLEQAQRRGSLDSLLANVVQNVHSKTDLEMILRTTVSELGKALEATDGLIFLTPEFLEPGKLETQGQENGGHGTSEVEG